MTDDPENVDEPTAVPPLTRATIADRLAKLVGARTDETAGWLDDADEQWRDAQAAGLDLEDFVLRIARESGHSAEDLLEEALRLRIALIDAESH